MTSLQIQDGHHFYLLLVKRKWQFCRAWPKTYSYLPILDAIKIFILHLKILAWTLVIYSSVTLHFFKAFSITAKCKKSDISAIFNCSYILSGQCDFNDHCHCVPSFKSYLAMQNALSSNMKFTFSCDPPPGGYVIP